MAVNKVHIEEGCIACGTCVDMVPEVFEMDDVAVVKEGVDYSKYEDGIREAAEACPVDVIDVE